MNHERKNRKEDSRFEYRRSDVPSVPRHVVGEFSSRRKVQQSWSNYGNENSSGEKSRRRNQSVGSKGSQGTYQGTKEERAKSDGMLGRKRTVTLENIRKALSKEQLQKLLKNNYNPSEIVEVEVEDVCNELDEDVVLNQIKRKRKRTRRVATKKPNYDIFPKKYLNWKKEPNLTCNADVVYGAYLELYRVNFGEKDPEHVDYSHKKALLHINNMCHKLADGEYEQLIDFIEKFIPLWAMRMRKGESFPTARPKFDTFFVKRGMWSQRFSTYNQWASDAKRKI